MGKRKRRAAEGEEELLLPVGEAKKKKLVQEGGATPTTIQIILGTYEKVLHGITVSTKPQVKGHDEPNSVEFADTFLLNAHTSAIRCLAVRISQSSNSHSVSDPGSQDMFREQRPLCTSCTRLIAWPPTIEAMLTPKCA